jgi:hypothetical protein
MIFIQLSLIYRGEGRGMNNTNVIWIGIAVGGVSSIFSILLTIFLIYRHLKHWNDARGQTYIVRILLMVPIYAIVSWMSLLFAEHTLYFNMVRDCYEAFVLYQFMSLLLHYFDREMSELVDESDDATTEIYLKYFAKHDHPFPCCCLPSIRPGLNFLLVTKRCVMQYVLIKAILSIVAIVLEAFHLFGEGSVAPHYGYPWITFIVNVSMTVALYALILLYDTIEEVIRQHRPLNKFLTIKLLIFFIFWQSLAIDTIFYFQLMPRIEILKNVIVCLEMMIVSITNLWIFPYASYRHGNNKLDKAIQHLTIHVLNPNDIINDAAKTVRVFH